ncbi:MAG TPA: efflux RND transporter periplasmic adaptor subunit [Blastocatellia bacterium]|nr:efflux RND transporter periplasmic adaptor subunit [Blastocatellia bacterium]
MSEKSAHETRDLQKYTPQGGLIRSEQKAQSRAVSAEIAEGPVARPRARKQSRDMRKWLIRLGVLSTIGLIIAFFVWRSQRPTEVTLVQPRLTTITETIASSGRVGGTIETLVGAQATGIVGQLFVKEGDRVAEGERLAVLKNDVFEAQVAQAEQAISTARAQVAQTARGPLSSEVEAAAAQVRQAQAQVEQQQAAITQAQRTVAQSRAQLRQFEAERELASKEMARSRSLLESGVISRAEFDQAQTNLRVAQQRVAAQRQSVELAQSGVEQARAALASAQANLRAQQAQLKTVQSGARSEDVQVARQRLREAEQALRVARQQAQNAVVIAPFAGVVTEINAEVGQTVGAQGVLELVSDDPEIRLDVDESNLADLQLGQNAIISSSTFPDSTFQGKVTEIGAAVDVARGTVQVTVVPVNPPDWLRPGQTVNVNIVTARNVERLLVPPTALAQAGDRTVVFVIENGAALEKPVVTRPPTDEGVPVLAGLVPDDRIIADAGNIEAGQAVRVKDRAGEKR